MKVILSTDPVKFPLTGIGRYTYELGSGLQNATLDDVQFFRNYRLSSELPKIQTNNPMAQTSLWKRWPQKSRMAVQVFRKINHQLSAHALRKMKSYIYHGPNYYLPQFDGRSVVTIHDLSNYVWTQAHPSGRVQYMQQEMYVTLKRATAIITDAYYTRTEISRYFGWPLNRIYVVPLASGAEFSPKSQNELIPVLNKFELQPGGYTLFVGTIEPRKNLDTLLNAYSCLPPAVRNRWPLVIAGYHGWKSDALHERMRGYQREGWLRYLGFVSHQTLPLLMAGAHLFVFPSHYEGFGLPVLEAMGSGVPVVCSNSTSLPEVAGAAAIMHDPADENALHEAIKIGLEDNEWRANAITLGRQQAQKFSWDRCTKETLAVYRAVANY